MISQNYETIFSLLQAALFHRQPVLEGNPDWKYIFSEMSYQTVTGITAKFCVNGPLPDVYKALWKKVLVSHTARFTQIIYAQRHLTQLLEAANIPVAVMKGCAAAVYYPNPELRSMGDVDLLVKPESFQKAYQLMLDNGYVLHGEDNGKYHVALIKDNVLFELHRSPAGLRKDKYGEFIRAFMESGLDHIERKKIDECVFPILPWKQNGLELIWHIKQHLYNGLGLRQILDWMMFVDRVLDDGHYGEFKEILKKSGLNKLAIVVTRMCQIYLGLRTEGISWCRTAKPSTCEALMNFIVQQGNFGSKMNQSDKVAKVLTGYDNPVKFFARLQEKGMEEWALAKRHAILRPFAWCYALVAGMRFLFGKKGAFKSMMHDVKLSRQRRKMLKELYVEGPEQAE